jgi:quercetin dioxygenase-like cupin family protein
MLVKAAEAKQLTFYGVTFDVLAVGEKSMVTKMRYEDSNSVPMHSHPNEQSGYVISGKYRLIIEEQENILTIGDSYSIPANAPHSIEIVEAGEVIDVFTPPREDYLKNLPV